MRRAWKRLAALFRRDRLDREMENEIAGHLELAERDALCRGLSPDAARREARQAFGGLDAMREAHRDARSARLLETLWRDVRLGGRSLARTPLVSLLIVLVLGLAIGANATMFSALRGIVLRPLAYGEPDDLVIVMHGGRHPVSYANFDDWRRETRSFSAMGAAEYWRVNLGLDEGAERLLGLRVTADVLPMLQVQPLFGRLPSAEAFEQGDTRQVVVAHGLWQRQFGGDPAMVGRAIRLDGEVYTVVAVMPPGFVFAPFWAVDAQLWAPLPATSRRPDRGHNSLRIFARLARGTSVAAAQADVDAVTARLEALFPASNRDVRVVPLRDRVLGDTRLPMIVFMVGVALVLMIACANVAHVLLARAAGRRRDVAVRLALGATRWQIVRQFLVESLVLASAAAAVGIGCAVVGVRALVAAAPPELPRTGEVQLDAMVLVFTVLVAMTAGIGFGLAPAWHAVQGDAGLRLSAGRGASADRRQARVRGGLMASEVALSLVLVAAAGLMVRSLIAWHAETPGFSADGVLAFSTSVTGTAHAEPARRPQFFTDLTARLEAVPGVEAVSAINHLPLEGDMWTRGFVIDGRPLAPVGEGPAAVYRVVLPGYFETMRLPLRRGRDFTPQDVAEAPGVAIISENLARRHWPDEDPIGARILVAQSPSDPDAHWRTIVGIAADAARESWEGGRGDEVYLPFLQAADYRDNATAPFTYLTFVVRERTGNAAALMPTFRRIVASMDPGVAVSDVITMDAAVARALARPRFQVALLSACAGLALVLAAAGIYGVVNYGVSRRMREIGLRMALGARQHDVRSLVVGRSLRLVGVGLAVGWTAALGLGHLMAGLLHGVTPSDPLTLATATLVLVGVAVVASAGPAWRASRIDPAITLRQE